ncbi:uncharacterized protein PRCAT00000910001 [Priceomyces carsonii]|uniref:uncharacterized protein n=1 Tax=Priceomyces carsonii TaxID=28549 RepID=UPI002ED89B56|nr:unnamed protein product [Priceomyces carsonii]
MKRFEVDTENFSKTSQLVGGIAIHLYNSDSLIPYVELFNKSLEEVDHSGINKKDLLQLNINVLYFAHGRTRSYKDSESLAKTILKQFYSKKNKVEEPLICVVFDDRNHGDRTVDSSRNSGWTSGNDKHALDMVSIIDGTVQDIKLIMDYLPSFLNLEFYLSPSAKENFETKIAYRNGISGTSLGGHIAIRFGYYYPELVEYINPIIGCSDLSSLLLNRLLKADLTSSSYDIKWFYKDYKELGLSENQKQKQYPETFHKYLSNQDIGIFENYPFSKIRMFATFGELDKLVPPRLSRLWVEIYKNTNSDTDVYIQKGAGHEITAELIDKFTSWLVKYI